MPKINSIEVQVSYRVGLGNVKIPKKALKELMKAADKGHEIDMSDNRYPHAFEWLINNINERDSMDWEAGIEELTANNEK